MSKKDSDPIVSGKIPDEFMAILVDSLSGIQYKLIAFIFIFFIILSSSTFIDRVLTNFSGAVDGHDVKNWGIILQGLFLVMSTIAIDALIKNNML
jgi:hypothetical protein|tara:strand:- start:74244 stop:74528 length:285 start_codon:yes stop_codon:yes gene_type:complete